MKSKTLDSHGSADDVIGTIGEICGEGKATDESFKTIRRILDRSYWANCDSGVMMMESINSIQAEHAALEAVAEAANDLGEYVNSECILHSSNSKLFKLRESIKKLEAVRGQKEGGK